MPEFELDNLKKSWQEKAAAPKYNASDIESMLNKSSRSYVKYILWISIAEFTLILAANFYYGIFTTDGAQLITILTKLGMKKEDSFESSLSFIYASMKVSSILMSGIFVVLFYLNYHRIKIECNLKSLILQIIRFKRTVQLFIMANIALVIIFTLFLAVLTFSALSQQHIYLNSPTLLGFIAGVILTMAVSALLIWIYYRIVYGFILRKLSHNLRQLQNIEEENN